MINTTIQSFTIQKKLGAGGMATVYLAENSIGKKAAIKVLHTKHFHDTSVKDRFVQEAKVMARLHHPNICSVISMEETSEFAAIIMEHLEGQDLSDYVSSKGAVSEDQALAWLEQISKALDYAHSEGVIHRDIKPSNFFLTNKGQVKVMDFGIAKAQDSMISTHTNSLMGSIVYMSPEQIKSPKYVSHKTDIYSLGVTLHHLLAGRIPYDITTHSEYAVMDKIIKEPLPILKVSDNLNRLIQTATQKDPKDRPENLDAWLEQHTKKIKKAPDNITTQIKSGANDKNLGKDDKGKTEKATHLERPKRPIQKPKSPSFFEKHKLPITIVTLFVVVFSLWHATQNNREIKENDTTTTTNIEENDNLSAYLQVLIDNMVYVEGGTFTMGCTGEQADECEFDEKPSHDVTLSSYNIGKYEVTQAQWEAVMGYNPSYNKNCNNCPIEQVSWNDVQDFISKLNQLSGKQFRLPTEAEWEFSARGGNKSKGYKFAGSSTLDTIAWNRDNSDGKTHPTGQKKANELGLYDMTGNVYEWCSDWYGNNYKLKSLSKNPKGPENGTRKMLRGGSYSQSGNRFRVADRYSRDPSKSYAYVGLRLVVD